MDLIQTHRASKSDVEVHARHPSRLDFGNEGTSCLEVRCVHLATNTPPSRILKIQTNNASKSDVDFQTHHAVKEALEIQEHHITPASGVWPSRQRPTPKWELATQAKHTSKLDCGTKPNNRPLDPRGWEVGPKINLSLKPRLPPKRKTMCDWEPDPTWGNARYTNVLRTILPWRSRTGTQGLAICPVRRVHLSASPALLLLLPLCLLEVGSF